VAVARANPKIACDFGTVVEGEVDGIRHSYAILTLAASASQPRCGIA
jgi:hypothetical protein